MNKKAGMGMMGSGGYIAALIFGIIIGAVLMAFLANHGILDPSMIPI